MRIKHRIIGALLAGTMAFSGVPAAAEIFTVAASAASKLAAPSGFHVPKKTKTALKITWDAVKGADAYGVYIYNYDIKDYELYKNVTDCECIVKGLYPGTKYTFKVASLVKSDKGYSVRAVSKKFAAVTNGEALLLPPANIRAVPDRTTVTVTWDKRDGADAYIVYKYSDKTGRFEQYKTVTGNMCTVRELSPDTKYRFAVAAAVKSDSGFIPQNASSKLKVTTLSADIKDSDYVFKVPPFGVSGKTAVKLTGLKGFKYTADKTAGGGSYTTTFKRSGHVCTVTLSVNANDRLYSCLVSIPTRVTTAKKARSLMRTVYGYEKADIAYFDATLLAWVSDDRTDFVISAPKRSNIVYAAFDLGLAPDLGTPEKLDMSGVMEMLG